MNFTIGSEPTHVVREDCGVNFEVWVITLVVTLATKINTLDEKGLDRTLDALLDQTLDAAVQSIPVLEGGDSIETEVCVFTPLGGGALVLATVDTPIRPDSETLTGFVPLAGFRERMKAFFERGERWKKDYDGPWKAVFRLSLEDYVASEEA